MARSVRGVIMPRDAEPSGISRTSVSASVGTAKQVPAVPSKVRLLRDRNCRRVHMVSISLLPPLLRDGSVITLDEVIVFGQEGLGVRVGVHLGPQCLGQMPPHILVQVGRAVLGPLGTLAACARLLSALA